MEAPETHTEAATHTFDWTDADGPSTAVVTAVSAVSGDDPTAIDPLYAAVDPDSLDALFAAARSPRLDGSVAFEYHGYRVTVRADGHGVVRERPDGRTGSAPGADTGGTEGSR